MNRLAKESSPYLLQHAHNPVDWYPWGPEALQRARAEDKPLLLSIGYSACHWCHVMERESFERHDIAEVMNLHFVCVKVDREERPDIDQIYMDAVGKMGLQGGWPLNVFLMPDGKPFYGGTYFPPARWQHLLGEVARAYREHRPQLQESAQQFAQALQRDELAHYQLQGQAARCTPQALRPMVERLLARFDMEEGGTKRAPKFPMPSIYAFLLHYHALTADGRALEPAMLTLRKMARGGIYDQAGGGFARYSVDAQWFAPHFEKMLYDNGQLLSLYALAYRLQALPELREVLLQTAAFAQRELRAPEGGFYAALDADSEGVEGRFYVWTLPELQQAIPAEQLALCMDYYQCTEGGNWEHGYNILHRKGDDLEFCHRHGLEPQALEQLAQGWKERLLQARGSRVRPGLDDKLLSGWNGLMVQGLAAAYAATQESWLLEMAQQAAAFVQAHMTGQDGQLFRNYKGGKAMHHAYAEDYAAMIGGYLSLHEATAQWRWLQAAQQLMDYAQAHFLDPEDGFFFYTDAQGEALIARKKELFDNVIPASNSMMAQQLFALGRLLGRSDYMEQAARMLGTMLPLLEKELQYLSHWGSLYAFMAAPHTEVAVVGPGAEQAAAQLRARFLPFSLCMGAETPDDRLPLFQGRKAIDGRLTFYVCKGQHCLRPLHTLEEAAAAISASAGA